jgi:hypothetical protein
MAKLRSFFTPTISTFSLLAVFSILSLVTEANKSTNYLLAFGLGGILGLITLLIECRKNNFNKKISEFKVSMLPYHIVFVIALLGALGPTSRDMFFMIMIIGMLLVVWIGFITMQYAYKRNVIWE